ncbi:amino acid permease [Microbacterium paludicola]|uniref:Amino acid permease n=1 Tax=Microbacterium paludicola TaxID=300019 RepID=A0A4Y9FWF3_9MICO|nr:amino acid permease [Microbacterium paludicola]MBF0815786.1 amino acid permease [Microbacterium paludicola]TFU33616.1 amino acid permease [Microbacterium paludicola]
MSAPPTLARRLGLGDAVAIGLGAMIGAGVFSAFAPAAQAAGGWLLAGLAIAAVVAYCNATASAQLAAVHTIAGGTYAYGRAELGAWWGFAAGWCFVIGKLASCAAMAMTFAAYAAPAGWERPVAIAAVAALVGVNLLGVTRTALAAKIIVAVSLLTLAVAVAAGFTAPAAAGGAFAGELPSGVWGLLQSAGLLFFAFAGYARIATMGEEVRDPSRTIPRAITIAFLVALVVYAAVGTALLWTLGAAGTAGSNAPLSDAVVAAGWGWASPVVRVGAAAASLGALLALIAGIGRTSLAMAREHDLPTFLSAIHPRFKVPHRAELAVGVVVIAVVAFADLRGAIGFSSFGVLLYYLVANLAAYRQGAAVRRYPRWLQVLGAAGCVLLAFTLPWQSVVAGAAVLGIGLIARAIRLHRERARAAD